MRILITGSRSWDDPDTICGALGEFRGQNHTLVSGGCPTGADQIAEGWAVRRGWNIEVHPADWRKYGKAAGPKRNQEMVDLGADLCLAFLVEGSRGTADCVRRAEKAGITVKRFEAS